MHVFSAHKFLTTRTMPRVLPPPSLAVRKNSAGELVLHSLGTMSAEERLASVRIREGDLFYVVRPDDMRAMRDAAATPLLAALVHGGN